MRSWAVRSCGVCGRFRSANRKVSHDGHTHVGSDAHGNHVFCHLLTNANAGVITLGNDDG